MSVEDAGTVRPGGATPADDAPTGMRVVAGAPTPEELAAVTAVLHAAAVEADRRGQAVRGTTPRSGWDAARRSVRAPIGPGTGSGHGDWVRSLR